MSPPPPDGWNWHEARVEQQLREANAELRSVNDHLWELNQPEEVRSRLRARRAELATARRFGWTLVFALVGAWVVLSLLFGQAGSRVFGRAFAWALDALGVLIVVGGGLAIVGVVLRGARRLGLLGRATSESRSRGDA